MRKCLLLALSLTMLICGTAMVSTAATRKAVKPKPKPAHKASAPKASAPKPSVQLAGDNGMFGRVYSILKDRPLYFRLKSAEYTTDHVVVGEKVYFPKANEKLLVLHFTIQNPQRSNAFVRADSLKFNVVDAMNLNHDGDCDWGNDDDVTHPRVEMTLVPAQTINVFAPIVVPAKGTIPKLMIMPWSESNGPILRYDLTLDKNKVAALKAPIADPADPSGYTAQETVHGSLLNAPYAVRYFDIAVQKFEYTSSALDRDAPKNGGRFLMVTLLMKCQYPGNVLLRSDSVRPTLTSTDDEPLEYGGMILATANRAIERTVKFGEEATVRIYFNVPKDVTPKTLAITEDIGRTYEFAVQ